MFNLSLPELLVIGAAGLLVFGPKRLPELAKSLGKGIRDFKKAMEGEDEDEKNKPQAHQETLPPVPQSPSTPTEPRAAAEPAPSNPDPSSRKTS